MVDAFSIMSPSFTKPRRLSSLSTSFDKNQASNDIARQVGLSINDSSRSSKPDATIAEGMASPRKVVNAEARRSVSPPRLGFENGSSNNLYPDQSSQLDVKIMSEILVGKFGNIPVSNEHFPRFLTDVAAKLRRNQKPITVHSIDSSKESDFEDDATLTEDADVEPPLGFTKGTLERKVMRVRVPISKRAAAKSGLRR
jgi:hypothetical protein